ncbi:MAG: SDR family NAD(P)-dependent oxidoreductase [Aquincola sp.]|nr:SDR family NAD(P)-dependent oxidoreductase [Aquincola sp.]MDH5329680.1 SDR family NAD(P)-dependent oxidoreductase [Aquincola sp.]
MPLNPRITNWSSQVVWLVGASTGIGRATAERLREAGAHVVVSARNREGLLQFVRDRARAEALPVDVTDRAAVQRAARDIVDRHGRIDLVMYCAGHYKALRATAFDLDEMVKHQQINVVGAYHLIDAVLPTLLRQASAGQSAHLSLVASVAGYRGLPNALAYGPTKAALINLAEVLFLDLRSKGVGVSVINPGFVETPLTAGNHFEMPALITPEEAARHIVAGWEAGRFEVHFPKRFTLWLKALRLLGDGPYFAAIHRATGL